MKIWIKEPLLNQYETDLDDINQRIEYGIIHVAETLAWISTLPDWVALDQIPGIQISDSQPPPLPKPPPPLPQEFREPSSNQIEAPVPDVAPTRPFLPTPLRNLQKHSEAPTKSPRKRGTIRFIVYLTVAIVLFVWGLRIDVDDLPVKRALSGFSFIASFLTAAFAATGLLEVISGRSYTELAGSWRSKEPATRFLYSTLLLGALLLLLVFGLTIYVQLNS